MTFSSTKKVTLYYSYTVSALEISRYYEAHNNVGWIPNAIVYYNGMSATTVEKCVHVYRGNKFNFYENLRGVSLRI